MIYISYTFFILAYKGEKIYKQHIHQNQTRTLVQLLTSLRQLTTSQYFKCQQRKEKAARDQHKNTQLQVIYKSNYYTQQLEHNIMLNLNRLYKQSFYTHRDILTTQEKKQELYQIQNQIIVLKSNQQKGQQNSTIKLKNIDYYKQKLFQYYQFYNEVIIRKNQLQRNYYQDQTKGQPQNQPKKYQLKGKTYVYILSDKMYRQNYNKHINKDSDYQVSTIVLIKQLGNFRQQKKIIVIKIQRLLRSIVPKNKQMNIHLLLRIKNNTLPSQ
eukprot:TRINITY_DN518_c0_g2_i1.p3 TRINITY_DN518_c0_g2~~TRINITY_DN518_c0_g2_i1.p3  ORF type:complete len:269 (-),score=-23.15 TRINITY_DN518_c0_g2_i1:825-1631(-)